MPDTERSKRDRHTLYLESSLMEQVNQAYRATEHDLYPQGLSKSAFLEALLAFSLAHLEEIKARLRTTS